MIGAPGLTVLASDGTLFNGIYYGNAVGCHWKHLDERRDEARTVNTFVVLGSGGGNGSRPCRHGVWPNVQEDWRVLSLGIHRHARHRPDSEFRGTPWGSLKVRYR